MATVGCHIVFLQCFFLVFAVSLRIFLVQLACFIEKSLHLATVHELKTVIINSAQGFWNFVFLQGHVDFSYEVSRSISACQGVLLIVDANQVQTQVFFKLICL